MLHAKQYEHALAALHRVLELAPEMPEAHVNAGFALLGLARYDAARDYFAAAIARRPSQANAYFGLAMALEAKGDLPAALGAMRSYIHLSRADDSYRTKARAAIWEWEQALGRHRGGKS
jgi:tetratricopeptide (TPR) repeat protein